MRSPRLSSAFKYKLNCPYRELPPPHGLINAVLLNRFRVRTVRLSGRLQSFHTSQVFPPNYLHGRLTKTL